MIFIPHPNERGIGGPGVSSVEMMRRYILPWFSLVNAVKSSLRVQLLFLEGSWVADGAGLI